MALTMDYWDSIDIGQPQLDHSQGFFREKHIYHEKIEIKQEVPAIKSKKPATLKNTATTNASLKHNKATGNNKENVPSNSHSAASSAGNGPRNNRAILAISIVKKPIPAPSVVGPSKSTTNNNNNMLKGVLKKSMSTSTSSTNLNKQPKLMKQNTLFEYAEIQKKHKEELARKLKAEAEKELKYKFHAKPAPKFIKAPTTMQPLVKQQSVNNVEEKKKKLTKQQSMPNLPVVKKTAPIVPSCGDPERLRAIEEHKKRMLEKYKPENVQFKAKPALVLHKPAFQPRHNFKAIDSKPFNLVLSKRLVQRSDYDKQLVQTQAIKKKQDETVQRQRDLAERKQMRQAREFKANPNPFGRGR